MATEKWIAGSGQGLTWGTLDTTALNSLVTNNALMSGTAITNGSALDIYADLDLVLASAAFIGPNFIGIYLYPLAADGSTYGDGRFGTAAVGPPPSNYYVGSIGIVAATQTQSGQLCGIILPPGSCKFVVYNQGGVTWAASGNTLKYRTYNRAVT